MTEATPPDTPARRLPDLHSMPPDRLLEFWQAHHKRSIGKATALLGKVPGRVTAMLGAAEFARHRLMAFAYLGTGDQISATRYARRAESAYYQIHEDLRWPKPQGQ